MIKDDLAYIDHILDCIRKIKEFSNGLSLKEFKTNELVQDAIIRNIEINISHFIVSPNPVSGKVSPDKSADNFQIYPD